MMKYRAIIENALLLFAFIVFCGGSFANKENQIANLKNNAETPINQEGEDGEHFPSEPEESVDGFLDVFEEKLKNSTSLTSSSEATTAITAMLPATNETSTTFATTTVAATTSQNMQLTSDFNNPNIISTSGSTQSPILANETTVSIVKEVNNSTGDANIKSYENTTKNNTTTLGWYSVFTTEFWKDQLYDQNYILAIVLPIAAGISLALIVVCACCILNRLCKRQRHIHVEKKNYYGRNADSDNKWMLLAPSSSDEEI